MTSPKYQNSFNVQILQDGGRSAKQTPVRIFVTVTVKDQIHCGQSVKK